MYYAQGMSKPTDDELKLALRAAIELKEQNADPYFIAKALLNHHYRLRYLEEVLRIADRYINHGMGDRERTELIQAINKARTAEDRTAGFERADFGLE
jgi:hypothetical protein